MVAPDRVAKPSDHRRGRRARPGLFPGRSTFDVLLRHRLLRQPDGFEGRFGIAVAGDSPDPTLVQLVDESGDRIDLRAASSAASAHPPNHRNSLPAHVKLDGVNAEGLPILVDVAEELPHAFMASIDDALELRPERPPLAVLGRHADQLIDITR